MQPPPNAPRAIAPNYPSAPLRRVAVPVSVVMTAYNQERFVGEAIGSVLDQTFPDFELVVVNDGSTDGTEAIIHGFHDARLTCISQPNSGESAAIAAGIARAKGRYIAFMDGDDVCHPARLERQLAYLRAQCARVVTSWIELIDDAGAPLHDLPGLLRLANSPPCRTRAETIARLWAGNFLWPSSALFERTLLAEAGGVSLTLAQLQDLQLWIELAKRTHIHTIPEPLLSYRVRAGWANASLNPANAPRVAFEVKQVYRRFFDGLPEEMFRAAFARQLRNPALTGEAAYAAERAFLYLTHPNVAVREIGVERLAALMQNRESVRFLESRYGFALADFFTLSNDPAFRSLPWRAADPRGSAR